MKIALRIALSLFLLGSLSARADKTVVALITDKTTIGPGTLIVSSGTDVAGSLYSFQLSRCDGRATVLIEETINGGAWTSVGTMVHAGDTLTGPACGSCAFRANVVMCDSDPSNALSVYLNTCTVTVIGSLSGTPTLTVLTPTATAAATSTPTKTPTSAATATKTPTSTFTPTRTPTPTVTLTFTSTTIPTSTMTPTKTATFTRTATFTKTITPTVTPTHTITGTFPSPTPTPTNTATPTVTSTPKFIGP